MDGVSVGDEIQLDRIHYVLHLFETVLNKADPFLVPFATLDNVNSHVTSISSYSQEYKRSRSSGQQGHQWGMLTCFVH
ncbi:hypothetical protein BC351_14895 [Paenibacillus ferrarius]|uniref:Uncharacterized protein n=1 Tax=Paenibacillus ferrarius TaxID=1469647 RepID=A0A1V4HSK5_9BACL|nr:hypothetical protein BC351_14895 [Paenibacillus ferrarius]